MEASAAEFPWRQLGALLLEQDLVTNHELEQGLTQQARSGRLLGQILVDNGYLSAFSLARVLSEQHGIRLQAADADADMPVLPSQSFALADPPEFGAPPAKWRPLGKLLVEQGVLGEEQLADALGEQQRSHGRLGEILISRKYVSGVQLARALADQHGVDLDGNAKLETSVIPHSEQEPVFKVFEVHFEPGWQRRVTVCESPNFLDAADFAFEYVEEHEPVALEIHRTHGESDETVWSYSEARAAAVNADRKGLTETFGFDPTSWGKDL
jgi:hypothetical protein